MEASLLSVNPISWGSNLTTSDAESELNAGSFRTLFQVAKIAATGSIRPKAIAGQTYANQRDKGAAAADPTEGGSLGSTEGEPLELPEPPLASFRTEAAARCVAVSVEELATLPADSFAELLVPRSEGNSAPELETWVARPCGLDAGRDAGEDAGISLVGFSTGTRSMGIWGDVGAPAGAGEATGAGTPGALGTLGALGALGSDGVSVAVTDLTVSAASSTGEAEAREAPRIERIKTMLATEIAHHRERFGLLDKSMVRSTVISTESGPT